MKLKWLLVVFTEFYWVSLFFWVCNKVGLTSIEFYWLLVSFTEFYWVLLGFNVIIRLLPNQLSVFRSLQSHFSVPFLFDGCPTQE